MSMKVFYFNVTYRCNSNCIFCAANHPLWQDSSEMTASEFSQMVQEQGCSSGDRVIVNGGEPTIHKEFWDILDAINQLDARIDLFTNGIKLKDESFVKRLLEYDGIHIRIPLFGSTPAAHDRLTGVSGNFEATVKGLDNLYKNIHGNTSIEVKMLLSKATVEENEKIYELVQSRWKHDAIGMSLNPLLISECVIQQKDLLIDTYEALMEKSEALIRHALNDGSDFSVGLVPYCTFPNRELLELCRGSIVISTEMFYASPGYKNNINKLDYRKPCMKCRFINECNGFSKNYIDYFGTGVMKPFSNMEDFAELRQQ